MSRVAERSIATVQVKVPRYGHQVGLEDEPHPIAGSTKDEPEAARWWP